MTTKTRLPPEGLFCNYSHRHCMQNRMDGYQYCIRHILEDKSAPFKQCNYVYPRNGKRCANATSKLEKKEGLCPEHSRKHALLQQKILIRPRKIVETPETLIDDLEHGLSEEARETGGLLHSDEFYTDSESERASPVMDQVWHGDGDSDAESVDSEQEDPLKHAGVYTAEEVALITRDKLIKLQSLYIEQFKRLQHVLKEKRRKYLHALKQEKETLGSIHETPRLTIEATQRYDKLKALNRYHKRHGPELLLHKQVKERRLNATEGVAHKLPHYTRCNFAQDGERCNERILPLSKFCLKHILHDAHQVLFRPCKTTHTVCKEPVIPAIHGPTCSVHLASPSFPPIITKVPEEPIPVPASIELEQLSITPLIQPIPDEMPLSRDLPEAALPSDSLSLFPSDLLVLQQPSPDTDVDK